MSEYSKQETIEFNKVSSLTEFIEALRTNKQRFINPICEKSVVELINGKYVWTIYNK